MYFQEFAADFSASDSVSLCIRDVVLEGRILTIREHSIHLQVVGEPTPRTLDLASIWSCRRLDAAAPSLPVNVPDATNAASEPETPPASSEVDSLADLKAKAATLFAAPDAFFRYPEGVTLTSYSIEKKLRELLATAHNRFRSAKDKGDTSGVAKSIDELDEFLRGNPGIAAVHETRLLLSLFCASEAAQRFALLDDHFGRAGAQPDAFWESYALAAYESASLTPFFTRAAHFEGNARVMASVRVLQAAPPVAPERAVLTASPTGGRAAGIPAGSAPRVVQPTPLAGRSRPLVTVVRPGMVVRPAAKVTVSEATAFEKANTLVMAGRKDEAVALLAETVKAHPHSVRLWDLYAAQLCGLRRDDEAITAYEHLIRIADTRARNHYVKQVVFLNRRKELPPPLPDRAQDMFSLDFDEAQDEAQKDEDTVSDFLQQELEECSITDSIILRNNGTVTSEDANRLLSKAKQARDKTFYVRYPLFLEAAKAFSELSARTPEDELNYKYSLSCYALQRAGSIVAKMRSVFGQLTPSSSQELAVLCDSALSYYIEGINLAPEDINLSVALLPSLTSYLEAQLLFFFRDDRKEFLRLFGAAHQSKNFRMLISHSLDTGNEELFKLIWESMLTWRRNVRLWKRILKLDRKFDGPHRLFEYIEDCPAARDHFRAYMLNELDSARTQNERLTILYVETAKKRAKDYRRVGESFDEMKELPVTGSIDYFTELREMIEDFPHETRALFRSDREAFDELGDILAKLRGYANAGDAAKGDMLVNARLKLSNSISRPKGLRDRLVQNSSYWKRVALLPIIENCLKNIEIMEARIQNARRPRLHIFLEPESFHREQEGYATILRLRNSGPADAADVPLTVRMSSLAGEELFSDSFTVPMVEANGCTDSQLAIPEDAFRNDPELRPEDVILQLTAAEGMPYSTSETFSLDIDEGRRFTREELPWVIDSIPQKLFGRDELLAKLKASLGRQDRTCTHMLYGVTRSGKSSILKFLRGSINGMELPEDSEDRRIFCIDWQFNKCHEKGITPADLWQILMQGCFGEACANYLADNGAKERNDAVHAQWDADAEKTVAIVQKLLGDACSKAGWLRLIDAMRNIGLYPVFLIDEFTEYKDMFDEGLVGRDFLSSMRDTALEGKATFFVAGTYDIKDLLTDDKYGITGQFVNLRQHFVTSIKPEHARELVTCFDRLTFTEQAQELIIRHADNRPYLIQIICSNCGQYALDNRRSVLGATEVERVIRALAKEVPMESIAPIGETAFNKNLIFSSEDSRKTLSAVLSLLCHEGREGFLSYGDIVRRWTSAGLVSSDLNAALEMLRDREVIAQRDDEGRQGYGMRVPLFSRWWKRTHPNLAFDLNSVVRPQGGR